MTMGHENGRLRRIGTTLLLALLLAGAAVVTRAASEGAPPAVPAEYRAAYDRLDRTLDAFIRQLERRPPRPSGSVIYATSVLPANANRGLALLLPGTEEFCVQYIDRLRGLGITGVTFDINFPILDPAYYAYRGQPAQMVDQLTDFYRRVAGAARARGMTIIVESSQVFTEDAFSSLPVRDYYRTLDLAALEARRLAMLGRIVQAVRPDYLTVSEESDTMQRETGLPVDDPDVLVPMVGRFVKELRAPGRNLRIGAGYGTWHLEWRELGERFLRETGVDFLNLHIYGISRPLLVRAIESATLARSHGKTIVVGEAWVYKTIGRGEQTGATNAQVFARDVYSFWAPLDSKFLGALALLAERHGFAYVSPFWSTYLFAYADYDPSHRTLPQGEVLRLANEQAAKNVRDGIYSPTGEAYREVIASRGARPTTTSSIGDERRGSEPERRPVRPRPRGP